MEKHKVPSNYRIENCCQLLDICFPMASWFEAKGSWVFSKFCIFPTLVISLKFDISEK